MHQWFFETGISLVRAYFKLPFWSVFISRATKGEDMLHVTNNGSMSNEDMLAMIAKLKAENNALRTRSSKALTVRVSKVGAVSVYGLGRFPVTLYKSQWDKLLGAADDIKAFIVANESQLAVKGE
jgi:hypothetical protein